MKIMLEAFNKLRSHPMDVPEDTGRIFRMALTQPLTAIVDMSGQEAGAIPPLHTVCEFEYTGKTYSIENNYFKIYALSDIYKQ